MFIEVQYKQNKPLVIQISDAPVGAAMLEETQHLNADEQFRIILNYTDECKTYTWRQFMLGRYFEYLFDPALHKPSAERYRRWLEIQMELPEEDKF